MISDVRLEARLYVDESPNLKLTFSQNFPFQVPMRKLMIRDGRNNVIDQTVGPIEEDSPIDLLCEVSEGGFS